MHHSIRSRGTEYCTYPIHITCRSPHPRLLHKFQTRLTPSIHHSIIILQPVVATNCSPPLPLVSSDWSFSRLFHQFLSFHLWSESFSWASFSFFGLFCLSLVRFSVASALRDRYEWLAWSRQYYCARVRHLRLLGFLLLPVLWPFPLASTEYSSTTLYTLFDLECVNLSVPFFGSLRGALFHVVCTDLWEGMECSKTTPSSLEPTTYLGCFAYQPTIATIYLFMQLSHQVINVSKGYPAENSIGPGPVVLFPALFSLCFRSHATWLLLQDLGVGQ